MKWYIVTQGFGLVLGGVIIVQAKNSIEAMQKAYVKWTTEYPGSNFDIDQCQVDPLDNSKTWIAWDGNY